MIAIVAITKEGKGIAEILKSHLSGESKLYRPSKGALRKLVGEIFDREKFEGIIFIMSLGIVVRLIAAHLKDKYRDPAVVVVDEAKRFAISVVSGHQGGANSLAVKVGNILDAEPVITTASEANKKLVIGIGCRRGVKKDEIIEGIRYAISKAEISLNDVRRIATIDLKKDESGLKEASLELAIPLRIVSFDAVRSFQGKYSRSSFVKEKIGVEGVSEPCALLAARNPKLILPKERVGRVTVAVAKEV